MNSLNDALNILLNLKQESKFEKDDAILYPGIERIAIKTLVSELIDKSIDEFILQISIDNLDENGFRILIDIGLHRFDQFNLDTEDSERVCGYYQQIMDAIGLESSNGIINNWLYGFDI